MIASDVRVEAKELKLDIVLRMYLILKFFFLPHFDSHPNNVNHVKSKRVNNTHKRLL